MSSSTTSGSSRSMASRICGPLPASATRKPWPPRYSHSIVRTDGSSSTISSRVRSFIRAILPRHMPGTQQQHGGGSLTARRLPAPPETEFPNHTEFQPCIPIPSATPRSSKSRKRVRWDIDRDVIRGRSFDYGKTFLPAGLSLVDELEFLSPAEQRLLSQVQGRTYAYMFGLVERFIGAKCWRSAATMASATRSRWRRWCASPTRS